MVTCRQRASIQDTLGYLVDDPNLHPDEAIGHWAGHAIPALFGVESPEFNREQLAAVLDRRDPFTREPLGNRTTVPGYELTVTLDKSVSIAALCLNHPAGEKIQQLFREAITGATRLIEQVLTTSDDKRFGLPGVTCSFFHRSSRWTDPHLHAHIVVANLAIHANKWVAVGSRGMFAATRLVNHYVQRFMLAGLSRIGFPVKWDPATRAAVITSIPETMKQRFSTGRASVMDTVEAPYTKPSRFANFHVRPDKPPTIDFSEILSPDEQAHILRSVNPVETQLNRSRKAAIRSARRTVNMPQFKSIRILSARFDRSQPTEESSVETPLRAVQYALHPAVNETLRIEQVRARAILAQQAKRRLEAAKTKINKDRRRRAYSLQSGRSKGVGIS